MKGKTGVKKPKKQKRESSYDWHDIDDFIRKKYGKDIRDWAGKYSKKGKQQEETEYQDFWHHLCDRYEIHNGATITIYPQEKLEDSDLPAWQREVYEILLKEFGSQIEALCAW